MFRFDLFMMYHKDVFLPLQFFIESSQQPCILSRVYSVLHMSFKTGKSMYFVDLLKVNLRAVIEIIIPFSTKLHLN